MTDRKVALVTGANKSIGFEVVRALARLGMTVYLGSRDQAAGTAAAQALAAEGDVRPVRLDVTDRATMEAAVRQIDASHGKLDVLVNNAGVSGIGSDPLTADLDAVKSLFETNVWGPVALVQLATPLLRAAGSARVVNVSSGAGSFDFILGRGKYAAMESLWGGRSVKPFAYCTSKTTLNAATIILADALKADGVKVNAANPGLVKSALSRFAGERGPEEGAKVIVHLATLPDDGPTGGFFEDGGETPW
jgi:NAD(P)-dependent dehydrogenase (short-subunit alcohol dehydrogenase family)